MKTIEMDRFQEAEYGIKQRPLTARESALLFLKGTPDKDDVRELIEAKDTCQPLPQVLVSNTYYSSEADNFKAYQNYVMTSTNLLDHLLQSADPEKRRELSNYGISVAANMQGHLDGVTAFWHTHHDVKNKLILFAKHGGDMNRAILATEVPALITRNADIALVHGGGFNAEAGRHILDKVGQTFFGEYRDADHQYRPLLRKERLAQMLELGLTPTAPIQVDNYYHDTKRDEKITSTDPLALSMVVDPTLKLFEHRLAMGKDKINEAELFYAALHSEDPASTIKKLKGLGMDINARDAQGRTALIHYVSDIDPKEFRFSDKLTKYNLEQMQLMVRNGADSKIKDNQGLNAEDYFKQATGKASTYIDSMMQEHGHKSSGIVKSLQKDHELIRQAQDVRAPFGP